jgi:hypothetical protein
MTPQVKALCDQLMSKIDLTQDRNIHFMDVIQCFQIAKIPVKGSANSIRPSIRNCHDVEKLKSLLNEIQKVIDNHILFGNKAVVIFEDVSKSAIQELMKTLDKVFSNKDFVVNSDYVSAVSEKINIEGVVFYKFKTERVVRLQEPLDKSQVVSVETTHLQQYTSFIGVKETLVECFDAIILDESRKRVLVHVDMVSILKHRKEIDVLNSLCGIVNNVNGIQFKLNLRDEALNVFRCVDNFYKDSNSKGVTELRFFGSDGASHLAKSPSKIVDIRDTNVHKGGVKEELINNQNIRNYFIVKNIPCAPDVPFVTIGVSRRVYDNSGTVVETKVSLIDGCKCLQSYLHCINEIIKASK